MKNPLVAVRLQILLVCVGAISASRGVAQVPGTGPGGPAGMSSALSKIFGDIKGFTAKANVRLLDSDNKEQVSMPMEFVFLDGKVRVEVNMEELKNSNMPAGTVPQLKQMGISRVISIIRPDKKSAYVAYPDAKVMVTMPLPQEQSDTSKTKLEKTPLGKETVDGHPCVKNKVVIPDEQEKKVEATTWNATDMKDFPIKIQTTEKGTTSILHFTSVDLAQPDAKLFDPPAGYTHYQNQQELLQAVMSKMAGSPGEKK
jgi:hypothetical protein